MVQIDIQQYAQLARIDVSDKEADQLAGEIEDILSFVEQVQELDINPQEKRAGALRNVMREDENPHKSGKYTEKLLGEVPDTEGDYVKVKKIL